MDRWAFPDFPVFRALSYLINLVFCRRQHNSFPIENWIAQRDDINWQQAKDTLQLTPLLHTRQLVRPDTEGGLIYWKIMGWTRIALIGN